MATTIAQNTCTSCIDRPIDNDGHLNLLVIHDDRVVREACREAGISLGYHTRATESVEKGLWFAESDNVDIVLFDWNLSKNAALKGFKELKARTPGCEVVAIIQSGQSQSVVEAMKAGAFDCLLKPFTLQELKLTLEKAGERMKQTAEKRAFLEQNKSARGFGNIVGRAPEMERLYRVIAKAAQISHPVLILGESGTGKELVARSIHFSGPLGHEPFIPVDCGSLVPGLIESELFGHVKGAFTGALQSKPGLLTIADGGTVFLDEVGELPLDLQSKLLRAIQEKEVRPVGSTKNVPINVRILAATNRDLEQAVGQGAFRRDLYFRINVLTLRIPPLRERRQDIRLLISCFLEREMKRSKCLYQVSDEALDSMMAYDWPGNVRELENCLERCCALSSGPIIHITDLPDSIGRREEGSNLVSAGAGITPIADLERRAILAAIGKLKGDKSKAAKVLGIGKTTLYRKLKQYSHLAPP
ncbi:MAG TPA: sigma-54 dependent transcriptional regulator [Terriglobales bacterium]|nr:sigma-54 dependent transcriptional regulator [Terriglobales bacterium]